MIGDISLGEIKFPAFRKTVSIFTLLLFSLLLQNITSDILYIKSLFVSESDFLYSLANESKKEKEHGKVEMTCAMPFLLLQIHLLSSKK